MRRLSSSFLGLVSLSLLLTAAAPAPAAPRRAAIGGGLRLVFEHRPAMDGSGGTLPALSEAPVTIHFATRPTLADAAALKSLGVRVALGADRKPRVYGNFLLADIPASAIDAVAALPRVERIVLDGSPFGAVDPLDKTAAEVQATDVWGTALDSGAPVTGAGVTICDLERGIDVFHPLFFRADGGYFDWIDTDGDGAFTPGVDGVDLDGDGASEVLQIQNSTITDGYSKKALYGSGDAGYAIGLDWLYADGNGNGKRDFGPKAGFTEADPTYGERLFVADDVNGNGALDVGERLVALGTSKIKQAYRDDRTYRRGEDLIEFPVDASSGHGTSVAGVLIGGARGLTKLVGIAPDAELIVAVRGPVGEIAKRVDYCIEQGARVVLHEYGVWGWVALDGSTPVEKLIDETSQRPGEKGIVHVNPAGNLSLSQRSYKRALVPGGELVVPMVVTKAYPFSTVSASFHWRDTGRDLTFTLEDPNGLTMDFGTGKEETSTDWSDKWKIEVKREDSDRGTARLDLWAYSASNSPATPLLKGTWKLHVHDPSAPGAPELPLIGYVSDEMGWDKGIYFGDSVSEEHLVTHPATADHGIAVAAHLVNAWWGGKKGERAWYSGHGRRIDDHPLLWISAAADPISSDHMEGIPGVLSTFGGTSGAAPHVAGAAALLLQANPAQNGDAVKEAIRKGALVDEAVGEAPNDDYGYGKLRIYQSLYGKAPPGGQAPTIAIAPVEVEAGKEAIVPIEVSDADEPAAGLRIDLDREYDGVYDESLKGPSLPVKYDAAGSYRVKVRVTDGAGKESAALALITVKEPSAPPPQDEVTHTTEEEESGGCAVATPARSGGMGWIATAAALAMLGARRRRER